MEIRDYVAGDESSILQLFHASFGKPLSGVFWKWRFLENPVNKAMIKLMWDKDKLVGHYAVSPLKMAIGNEVLLSSLSMTTMTHPEYAGRGIFSDLANALYQDESNKSNLKAVFGFPNNNSHYGFIKNLKWKDLTQVPVFSISVSALKKTDCQNIEHINGFSQEHVNTGQKLTAPFLVHTQRSLNYLNWRYTDNPVNTYDIFQFRQSNDVYYAVVKVFSSFSQEGQFEVDILEFAFPADGHLLLQLLNAIKEYYRSLALLKINVWLPLADEKHIQLEKIGFVNTLPVTYMGIRVFDHAYSELEDSRNWMYSMGDSDIY